MRKFLDKIQVGLSTLVLHKFSPYAYMDSWYAQAFNGQVRRAAKLVEISDSIQPTTVIETGTFLGSSTPTLARLTSGVVHTIEINPSFAKKAQKRFDKNYANLKIHLWSGDSIEVFTQLLPKVGSKEKDSRFLCYLDAHWEKNIPTKVELELIDRYASIWVAVIDDFKVEHDRDYGYDVYQNGTIDLSVVPEHINVEVWVPKGPASQESGARRGTAYVFSTRALDFFSDEFFEDLVRIRGPLT